MRMTLSPTAVVASAAGTCPCKAARAEAAEHDSEMIAEAEERLAEEDHEGACCDSCAAAAEASANGAAAETFQEEGDEPVRVRWRGVLAMEDTETGDGRLIEAGALTWDLSDGGIPLRWTREDEGGHFRAIRVGTITDIERDGAAILGEGFLLTGSVPEADMVLDWLREGPVGVSVDLDSLAVDWVVPDAGSEEGDEVEELLDAVIMQVSEARVRAATLVDIPAFAEAKITLVDEESEMRSAIVASAVVTELNPAVPVEPPRSWFPKIPAGNNFAPAPYRFKVERDGHGHGYIATWDQCHAGFADRCVTAPRSRSGYREFHRGPVVCDDGAEVLTGPMFFATRHSDPSRSAAAAGRFYEDTGLVAADVVVGEDEHGIWASGALRPTVTPAQVREVRAAHPSGDWRFRNGSLELIATLMVNNPGFEVRRSLVASAFVEDDEVRSLQLTWAGSEFPQAENPASARLALIDADMAMRRLRARRTA